MGRESGWVINHGTLFINVTRVTFHDKVCAALVFLRHSDFVVQSLPPMQCKKMFCISMMSLFLLELPYEVSEETIE